MTTQNKLMILTDVGFVGLAGSGKNTAAKILLEFGWTQMGFADPLKEIAVREFAWNHDKDERGRKLLQTLGQAARAYKKDFWVAKARSRVTPTQRIAWTDVRYQNEVDFIRTERKGIIIRVTKPGEVAMEHSSESGQKDLKGIDFTVVNDGTVDQLHNKIAAILLQKHDK